MSSSITNDVLIIISNAEEHNFIKYACKN